MVLSRIANVPFCMHQHREPMPRHFSGLCRRQHREPMSRHFTGLCRHQHREPMPRRFTGISYYWTLMNILRHRLLYKWTEHWRLVQRCQHHNGPPTPFMIKICKFLDFCDKNRFIWITFNYTIFKFSKNFDGPFSHVFIFGNMFPESHGFDAPPVAWSNNFVSLH